MDGRILHCQMTGVMQGKGWVLHGRGSSTGEGLVGEGGHAGEMVSCRGGGEGVMDGRGVIKNLTSFKLFI